jgi:hypothetical protein
VFVSHAWLLTPCSAKPRGFVISPFPLIVILAAKVAASNFGLAGQFFPPMSE